METKCGVYKITNINNGRYYIGSSINIKRRWDEHKRNLRKNKHDNEFLQKSWNKNGENSFIFEIIEIIYDIEKLIECEQYHLDKLKPYNKKITYNICLTAGNMLGFKHSDKSKDKMSKSRIGNKNSLGHKHNNDTKVNMSSSHFGLKHKETTVIKLILKSKKDTLKTEKYKTTKISDKIKNELIEKYKTGLFSTRKLSELYNISKSTIWNIIRN